MFAPAGLAAAEDQGYVVTFATDATLQSYFLILHAGDIAGEPGRDSTDPLHYVRIPENSGGYDQGRDCPEKNCMVEALKWFSAAIADKNAPIMVRRVGLYYVAHLVGELQISRKKSVSNGRPVIRRSGRMSR